MYTSKAEMAWRLLRTGGRLTLVRPDFVDDSIATRTAADSIGHFQPNIFTAIRTDIFRVNLIGVLSLKVHY